MRQVVSGKGVVGNSRVGKMLREVVGDGIVVVHCVVDIVVGIGWIVGRRIVDSVVALVSTLLTHTMNSIWERATSQLPIKLDGIELCNSFIG